MVVEYINVKDLRKYFDDFNSKVVVDKKYKKLEYSKWKELKHFIEQAEAYKDYVANRFILVKDEEITLRFSPTSFLKGELTFSADDDSFGSYINTVVFPPYVKASLNRNDVPVISKAFNTTTDTIWDGASNYGVSLDSKPPEITNAYSYNSMSDGIFTAKNVKSSISVRDSFQDTKDAVNSLTASVEKFKNELNPFPEFSKKKEKKNMFNFNFDFGPVDGNKIRMSPYGMAVQNRDNTFVSYDVKSDKIMNVDVFNFDGSKFMYKMPVALNAVQEGDIVIHNRKPMFVTSIDGNRLYVIDVYEGESKAVIPTTNMFGFDFVTKVVSFIDVVGTPNQDNPFGNMLPFLMMSEDSNDDNFLMAMAMSQMNTEGNMFQNPMFLMALMKDNDKSSSNSKDDMVKMMIFSQMFSKMNATPAAAPVASNEQMTFMPNPQK